MLETENLEHRKTILNFVYVKWIEPKLTCLNGKLILPVEKSETNMSFHWPMCTLLIRKLYSEFFTAEYYPIQ